MSVSPMFSLIGAALEAERMRLANPAGYAFIVWVGNEFRVGCARPADRDHIEVGPDGAQFRRAANA